MLSPLDYAKRMLGMSEVPNQAQLQDYLSTGGANLDPATTAWCAAFVNSSLGHAGMKGTGSNMARSFLNWGQGVNTPASGDIGVLPRGDPNGPYGHVGFVDKFDPKTNLVTLLAGNQGNAVSEKAFPISQFLGFRRAPAGAPTNPSISPQAQNFVNNNPQPGGYGPGISDPNAAPTFGSMAPSTTGPQVANAGIPSEVAAYATADDNKKTPLQKLGAALQKFPDGPQARSQLPMPSADNGDALLKFMQNPNALTDFFLKKRLGQG